MTARLRASLAYALRGIAILACDAANKLDPPREPTVPERLAAWREMFGRGLADAVAEMARLN